MLKLGTLVHACEKTLTPQSFCLSVGYFGINELLLNTVIADGDDSSVVERRASYRKVAYLCFDSQTSNALRPW